MKVWRRRGRCFSPLNLDWKHHRLRVEVFLGHERGIGGVCGHFSCLYALRLYEDETCADFQCIYIIIIPLLYLHVQILVG
jgi:hypothetical protein